MGGGSAGVRFHFPPPPSRHRRYSLFALFRKVSGGEKTGGERYRANRRRRQILRAEGGHECRQSKKKVFPSGVDIRDKASLRSHYSRRECLSWVKSRVPTIARFVDPPPPPPLERGESRGAHGGNRRRGDVGETSHSDQGNSGSGREPR